MGAALSYSTNEGPGTAAAGARFAMFLRTYFGANAAKLAARELDVPERTVKHWLAGNMPGAERFAEMCRRFGPRFRQVVLGGSPDWTAVERLEAQREALLIRAEELDRQLAELRGEP